VDLVEEIEGIKMFNIRAIDGAIILDVTGYGTIPEPSTWALLILGGLGIFGVARKNRKAKK
ncbi:MAG: PEP-CTERM sorting domain-containing protein, partial [Thermoguttaceae bacterium]|nr:PEP-CTERM sorting domain-containing protein [Thermoguttaceae bacterium]